MGSIHKLIIEDDEGKTTVVPVSRGEISIGRMEGNTIRLMERNVSRRHARLLREAGSVFIEDLNSFNGVKINGERIDKRLEVKEGDLVEIGDYHLALQSVEVEDEAPNRAETVVQPPRLPDAAGLPHANGKNEAWRQMATVPDFSVNDPVNAAELRGGDADTANMRPTSLGPPDPVVAPPSPKASVLPPFPAAHGGLGAPLASPLGSGGLSGPALADAPFPSTNAGLAALRARDDAALRTEQIQVGPARVADVPRLVCVSTEYAGKDFPINRPEVVIGRVEDNDVVIEHRSVSRNHAKVMFDGRVHKIIDLQSANGILVNNEEYAITDLRKNDLIELGHVKFRFIPAGEPFVPTEEEAKAMLDAGVTPPPAAPAPVLAPLPPSAPVRALEPPTVPHKTQLDLRHLPGRDLAGQRTEELAPSDTVEMPVHVDPSTAATVTDTPIDVLGGPAFQPKITPEAQTERPLAQAARVPDTEIRASRRADTIPEPLAAPAASAQAGSVRVGGTAARKLAGPMDEDSDVRSSPGKSNRIVAAVGVVALLLAGLVVAILKLSGGAQANTHDQHIVELIKEGKTDAADAYLRDNWREVSNGPALMDAIAVARQRRVETVPKDVPDPTAAPTATPTPVASPAVTPVASPSEVPPPPEGDEPAPDEAVDGKRRPSATAAAAGDRAERAAAKKREQAKLALQEARSLMTFDGTGPEIEMALKKCLALDETLAECHYRLGVHYAKGDFREKSLTHYRRFLQLDPNAEVAANVRQILAGEK